jgi:hypothetical protein
MGPDPLDGGIGDYDVAEALILGSADIETPDVSVRTPGQRLRCLLLLRQGCQVLASRVESGCESVSCVTGSMTLQHQ